MDETGEYEVPNRQDTEEWDASQVRQQTPQRPQQNTQPPRNETFMDRLMQKRLNRRDAVKVGAGVVATGIAAKVGLDSRSDHPNDAEQAVAATETAEAIVTETPVNREQQVINYLNEINAMDIMLADRYTAEQAFAREVQSVDEVDQGLSICVDPGARGVLMEARWKFRTENPAEFMQQLTPEQIAWAQQNDIDPEVLAMCNDEYVKTQELIALMKDTLHPGLPPEISPESLMMNIGGMAKLIRIETSNFIHIGDAKAIDQLAGSHADEAEDLRAYTSSLRNETPFNYDADNIIGSVAAPGDESGGGIGIQFLPWNARRIHDLIRGVKPDESANIFNPRDAIKMAWVFLALHEQVIDAQGESGSRYGYLKDVNGEDNSKVRKWAIEKWNPEPGEISNILGAADDYYNNFLAV